MTSQQPAPRPVTYWDAAGEPWPDQQPCWDELDLRHHMTRAVAILKARGTYDPAQHGPEDKYPALTLAERLEMLARGEVIARHYRHPGLVHEAVTEGATWAQVAAAVGITEDQARAEYRRWALGQRRLWEDYTGTLGGMDETAYAAAIARCDAPQEGPS